MIKQTHSHNLAHLLSAGFFGIILVTILLLTMPTITNGAPLFQTTPTGVMAEAIGEANLRSGPGIEFEQVGQITVGTQYAVLGRHEIFPWLALAYPPAPGGQAWVFADLMNTTGPLTQVPFADANTVFNVESPLPTATLAQNTNTTATIQDSPTPTVMVPTATQATVFITANDDINVRFGPGIDYPRVARIVPGQPYTVIGRHTMFPWLLIELPGIGNEQGWVFDEVITVTGDIYTVPAISVAEVAWPTLTPTPPFVVTSSAPWQSEAASQLASINLQSVGDAILQHMLSQGFAPEEDRFGSVFLLDLASGESISLGQDIAYSGMSLSKIPLLLTYFRYLNTTLTNAEAEIIGNTMICSGNHTANAMMAFVGGGDELAGAAEVTETMQRLGLQNSFMVAPYDISLGREPTPQPYPIYAPSIDVDQSKTSPDAFNQATPEDLGWLLGAIYQCAIDETGQVLDTFGDQITPTECRQILLTMSRNQIDVLTEAGVPYSISVAHKHGWVDDTHGDAAVVFTPGGDFVLVMAFYQEEWLQYDLSWPTMAEIARIVYNAYNPEQPLDAIHPSEVDETCNLAGNPLLGELTSPFIPLDAFNERVSRIE